jgi:galactokinase
MMTTIPRDPLIASAEAAFVRRFGRKPRYAAAAPGRVNLIGEHTDYNEGFVLPMAIDRRAVIVADRAARERSTFWSVDLDQVAEADLTATLVPQPRGFGNYLLGVADQWSAAGYRLPNLDVAIHSSVPIGAGLASSAAVEVAFAHLLQEVSGAAMSPLDMALTCLRAEHAFPGTPCGIMDMLVATHARSGHALLIDCQSNRAREIPLPPRDRAAFLIADTGIRHDLADGAYAERRARCAAAAKRLGLPSLRHARPGMLAGRSMPAAELAAARHVLAENERTLVAAAALATGDLEAIGALMFDSHESLRDLMEVSCPELDALVEAAAALCGAGVFGARMTGAGMGGCAVVLCRPDALERVTAALEHAFRGRFGRTADCFAVAPSGRAGAIPQGSPRGSP